MSHIPCRVWRTEHFRQYVKQETVTQGEHGKEARATRLITERASRRIGTMAFEIAQARPRKVLSANLIHYTPSLIAFLYPKHLTVIHKSNVLSVTDGLFRETVRSVPSLPGIAGRFDDVIIAEQLVDSAVYRSVARLSRYYSMLTIAPNPR